MTLHHWQRDYLPFLWLTLALVIVAAVVSAVRWGLS